nr:group II intron maturase-specific domain-containing protein [Bradyrhizobium sp. 193]
MTPGNKCAWPEVQARLNRLLRGWSAYFSYGSLATAHQAVDRHVFDRVLAFLRRRHKTPGVASDGSLIRSMRTLAYLC